MKLMSTLMTREMILSSEEDISHPADTSVICPARLSLKAATITLLVWDKSEDRVHHLIASWPIEEYTYSRRNISETDVDVHHVPFALYRASLESRETV